MLRKIGYTKIMGNQLAGVSRRRIVPRELKQQSLVERRKSWSSELYNLLPTDAHLRQTVPFLKRSVRGRSVDTRDLPRNTGDKMEATPEIFQSMPRTNCALNDPDLLWGQNVEKDIDPGNLKLLEVFNKRLKDLQCSGISKRTQIQDRIFLRQVFLKQPSDLKFAIKVPQNSRTTDMALNRETNQTIRVVRKKGKIALEEAVGSPCFEAHNTYPVRPMIQGIEALPFSQEFLQDISFRLNDVEARIQSMDQSGISYSIVSLTAPGIEGVADAATAARFSRETNDAMHRDYVERYPHRFGFFACVAMHNPQNAAEELERAVTVLGAKGVLINGFTDVGPNQEVRYLDAPECEPFWAMLHRLNVPLYLHPRSPPINQQVLYHGYPNLAQSAYAFGVETAGHALRIMCSGILDKYPVKIILGHCAEALPFLIHRVDHRMSISIPGSNGKHEKTMMEYFQTHFYATLAGVRRESTLKNTIEELGESRVMFSVDYPYESNEDAADWFDGLQMNENTRDTIAFGNARRVFGITDGQQV